MSPITDRGVPRMTTFDQLTTNIITVKTVVSFLSAHLVHQCQSGHHGSRPQGQFNFMVIHWSVSIDRHDSNYLNILFSATCCRPNVVCGGCLNPKYLNPFFRSRQSCTHVKIVATQITLTFNGKATGFSWKAMSYTRLICKTPACYMK